MVSLLQRSGLDKTESKMTMGRTFLRSSCSQSHEKGFLEYLWPSPPSLSQSSPSVLLDNSHCQRGCTLWEATPNPCGNWHRPSCGTGPGKGVTAGVLLPKKELQSRNFSGKGMLRAGVSHLGSWSLAAAVKHHPSPDSFHLGISFPSAPLPLQAWGGQSREWGWTQNRARSREIGHPQGSFIMETTPHTEQRFSNRIWPSHPSFILPAGRSWDVLWIMSRRRPAQMS